MHIFTFRIQYASISSLTGSFISRVDQNWRSKLCFTRSKLYRIHTKVNTSQDFHSFQTVCLAVILTSPSSMRKLLIISTVGRKFLDFQGPGLILKTFLGQLLDHHILIDYMFKAISLQTMRALSILILAAQVFRHKKV
jgi:hypothetical protein